jgi:hypothetical protein
MTPVTLQTREQQKGTEMSPPEVLKQPGGPDGPLEREHRRTAIFGWLAFVIAR